MHFAHTNACFFALALLARVEFLEGLELLYECLVLVLEHGDAVLQTLDVLLLLVAALARRLPVLHQPHLALPRSLLRVALTRDAAPAAAATRGRRGRGRHADRLQPLQ